MSHATRFSLAIAVFLLFLIGAMTINFILVKHQVSMAQVQWCDTLKLLTSHPVMRPVNPAANPSRLEAWQLYQDFVSLRRTFGC